MHVHRDVEELPNFTRAVITFGSFDGVHAGHREIFRRMQQIAGEIDGETVVVTFHPHPRQVVYPNDKELRLLSSLKEKEQLFAKTGIDHLVVFPFSVEFSQMPAEEYIESFIVGLFHPAVVVIGYDHRFGLNRTGHIEFLRSEKWQNSFKVVEIEQFLVDQNKVSSTLIRRHISGTEISQANRLLGHNYLLSGKVVEGKKIGSELGYPTANLQVTEPLKLIPGEGIYAARVHIVDQVFEGMLYIGKRPTINDGDDPSIEVNIFDFHQEIYGREMTIEMVDFIRADATFSDLQALTLQLDQDKVSAREILQRASKSFSEAVVILNYNGLSHLKAYLSSVANSLKDDQLLVVADNGSDDGSLEWLQQMHPDVKTIALDRNHGFAGGYNEALQQIDADVVVLLNSDVRTDPGWIQPLINRLRSRKDIGACQPKIRSLETENHFEYAGAAGGLLDRLGYPFCLGRIMSTLEQDTGQYDQIEEVFWGSGAALCIRRDLFLSMGGFDADYFAHMEEIDLCWRLKRAGYKIAVVPSSVVYHLGGGTLSYQSPRKTFLNFRNSLSTLIKNESSSNLLWLLPVRILLDWVASLHFLLSGEASNFGSVWKAHAFFLVRLPRLLNKRWQIKKLIQANRIGPDNSQVGRYPGSIVYEFFLRGRKTFPSLNHASRLTNHEAAV